MQTGFPILDIRLLPHPVDARPLLADSFPQPAGAECVFLGRTREEVHPTHGRLVRLSYEAYEPMAVKVLEQLVREAVERFGCLAVRVHHAVCEVPPGEVSVFVQVITGHRAEAFDACRFLIDRLKVETPIWKKEVWEDGTTWSKGQPVEAAEAK